MTYKVGTKAEAEKIAAILRNTDPDNTYSVAPHEFPGTYRSGDNQNPRWKTWGVVASGHGFIWNAHSLAAWRAEYPIRAIA